MTRIAIRRALIAVYDKSGLEELARGLDAAGVEIVSTGGTAAKIASFGVPVTPVEALTGFPECLDGRVKTLHPRVHAGLLADGGNPAHVAQLEELEIDPFELVVVNLYPFQQTVASGASDAECVEQIDIGGPAMIRAAAKNHGTAAVVVDPAAYGDVLAAVAAGGFTLTERRRLAAAAYAHTASYDTAVASWFADVYTAEEGTWPAFMGASWELSAALRYGENPHQRAALYTAGTGGLAGAEQLHGKEMSYNNYLDADAAWRAAWDFAEPAVAIIKHQNPCGIAVGADVAEAHRKANACDPVSAYGGVIAVNGEVTEELARQIAEVFTEVVVATGFTAEALAVLTEKKNLRLLACPQGPANPAEFRRIDGGLLVQTADRVDAPGDAAEAWELKAGPAASAEVLADLAFAWKACRSVKSNAILLAAGGASVGVGMGQVNRVDSAQLAVSRAGDRAAGSVAASDAFFPFADGLKVLVDAGVKAIVEPGGSIRDDEVIAAAEAAGVTLYFTGTRHFFH
ncbi:bifunctional phosphoribosylaminoimidazolecarboxamide formyltransferase/IMP cyclohydrolase [Planomonospora parontospora]|uniref:bifunctional phosphoribosylaminoimidazolecarboxamide formyltransferase/IMP cyclohydrolase n=1 Tax=Planomonospora parontospora TaxID=58119 RepID=UPI00166FF2E2|nr:bifunctional phosphoribosylaminoimidazolecarboxamide formyltransferase/IMP cyclohydrolase [Planomonospora parontospora]GGL05378.1 bifunctional purine biosynthesis protein PurH [Planomonospora parontospora subsp. antibiotica]GII14331.1 bifunctional purine biosynthesis protein PurH [Planomonospora parontospora subsp. antibiotica]